MNRNRYRLVVNSRLGLAIPAGEHRRARNGGHGAAPADSGFARRRLCAALLGMGIAMGGSPSSADQPAGLVPDAANAWINAQINAAQTNASQMVIDQLQARAILDWQKFNLDTGQLLQFNQASSSWAALNRIHDADPSVINGRIVAPGQVYLINQNGIVFGQGAQVDVQSLVASTLSIKQEDFLRGLTSIKLGDPAFRFEGSDEQFQSSFVRIDPGARITTPAGGQILVFAPKVANRGSLAAPEGQIVLGAGDKIYLSAPTDPSLRGFLIEVDPRGQSAGVVANEAGGELLAARGNITLAALAVNQSGLARASTSVQLNGSIMLQARDSAAGNSVLVNGVALPRGARGGELVLGAGSRTEVLPEIGSSATIQKSQSFAQSSIELYGKSIRLESDAAVVAPNGRVKLTAQAGLLFQDAGAPAVPGARVYLDSGSVIDVSGTVGAVVPQERQYVEVELRGDELKDSPLQRNGFLRGKRVTVDARVGTPLADESGYLAQIATDVAERTATGGTITVRSEGDVVMRLGARLDVSGGSVRYTDTFARTTKLLKQDGRVVDIGQASPDVVYAGFADRITLEDPKWIPSATVVVPPEPVAGYVEGRDAGAVTLFAHAFVLDGDLVGGVATGPYQRERSQLPLGGRVVLEYAVAPGDALSSEQDLAFAGRPQPLPESFGFASDLNDAAFAGWRRRLELDTGMFARGGISRFTATANARIDVARDVAIRLAPAGSLSLSGRALNVQGDLIVPGGSVSLQSRELFGGTLSAAEYRVDIGTDSLIDVRGLWVNDSRVVRALPGTDPLVVNGGSVSIGGPADVTLAPGSVIDVSGGAALDASGRLRAGTAGSITLSTGRLGGSDTAPQLSRLTLDGAALRGEGLSRGGTLTLSTARLQLGGAPSGAVGELFLPAEFFQQGGFRDYVLAGVDGVQVAPGTRIAPLAQPRRLRPDSVLQPSAANLAGLTEIDRDLPPDLRSPGVLSLSAPGRSFGRLTVGEGASLAVDPGGRIDLAAGVQLTMLGTIEARAGTVNLTVLPPAGTDLFDGTQSVWLGAASRILAGGATRLTPTANGLRSGEVLPGGAVTLTAGRGYVIAESGSLIDIAGVSDSLDIRQQAGGGVTIARTVVAGDAGSLAVRAREGVLMDGTLRAGPGPGGAASGGTLTVAIAEEPIVDPLRGYPTAERRVVLMPAGRVVPAGLVPGQVVDATATSAAPALNGRAFVTVESIADSGVDRLALSGLGAVELLDGVALGLRDSLLIDAPVLRLPDAGSEVTLAAAYLQVANTPEARQFRGQATAGTGALTLQGRMVEFVGQVGLQRIAQLDVRSAGDVRLRGVAVNRGAAEAPDIRLEGALLSRGDIRIEAAQTYASSLSEFRVAAEGPGSRIVFAATGEDVPVLSAGSDLRIVAAVIEQGGRLKAPFGRLRLEAGTRLDLLEGSRTSVSGEGQLIPFGRTELSGLDYVYGLTRSTRVLALPPEKRIELSAPAVTVAGSLDLSGGGDLYAYEFVAGPGGSRDVLLPTNSPSSFAILPGLAPAYAPYDFQYAEGVTLAPGEQVHLSGVPGLADGAYTLLPARYALLPGAFLVTPLSSGRDRLPVEATARLDGSQIASGYHVRTNLDGSVVRDARTSSFLVESSAVVRARSEYRNATASAFFADAPGAQLPRDAGQLTIAVSTSLGLAGAVSGAGAPAVRDRDGNVIVPAGRGAQVDLSVPRLAVVSDPSAFDAEPSYVKIAAKALTDLKADSLLLGGTRSVQPNGAVRVVTASGSRLLIANDADSVLTAGEVMLVAADTVEVRAKSVIEGRGGSGGVAGSVLLSGNGAFLRAATGGPVALDRGGGFDRSAGRLLIDDGASILAAGALTLDATNTTRVGTESIVSGRFVDLAAGRINLGDVPENADGLTLTPGLVELLSAAERLTLKSYTSIDFYDKVTLGAIDDSTGAPQLRELVLDAAGLAGYGAGEKRITAGALALGAGTPVANPFATSPDGTGALYLVALADPAGTGGGIRLDAGTMTLRGFSASSLEADDALRSAGSGTLDVQGGSLSIEARQLTGETGTTRLIDVAGAVGLSSPGEPPAAAPSLGAALEIRGDTIEQAASIQLPAGSVKLRARGQRATDGMGLSVTGGSIDVSGIAVDFADTQRFAPGGTITLAADTGRIEVKAGAALDVAGAPAGGNAGALALLAPAGAVRLAGALSGGAAPGFRPGSVAVDALALSSDDALALAAPLNDAGFTAERSIRVRTGDVTIPAAAAFEAQRFVLAVDGGALSFKGDVDARGASGGAIELWARDALTLDADSRLDARALAPGARAGEVTLGTQAGVLTLASGSAIDVTGDTSRGGGTILLRAPRAGSDIAIAALNATIAGARSVVAEGVATYQRTTIGSATVSSINTDSGRFMQNQADIRRRLPGLTAVRPGVEVFSTGDLTLATDWNLYSFFRPGGQPGYLTLRAAGDLRLDGSLSDGFITANAASELMDGESWSYRLVAGAELAPGGTALAGANPLTLHALDRLPAGKGNVLLAPSKLVRTGTGFIQIAAGADLRLRSADSVIYTAGVPGPAPDGFNPPLLANENQVPAYATRGGDIAVHAQRDVIAEPSSQLVSDWLFRGVNRDEDGNVSPNPQSSWWVRTDLFRQGIGALAGGTVSVGAGGTIRDLSVSVASNGRLGGDPFSAPSTADLQVQGGGELRVRAGGDILGGLFYVGQGRGSIESGGAVRSERRVGSRTLHTLLALGDGSLGVTAARDVTIETVFNPTAIRQADANLGDLQLGTYFYTYGESAGVDLTSLTGNVRLNNDTAALTSVPGGVFTGTGQAEAAAALIYPGTLRAAALTGDLTVGGRFTLYPSARGTLELLAGRDLRAEGTISMSDVAPERLPNVLSHDDVYTSRIRDLLINASDSGPLFHSDPPLYRNAGDPVRVVARTGDIRGVVSIDNGQVQEIGVFAYLHKRAIVQAGGSVQDLWLIGQNVADTDVTRVTAGGRVSFSTLRDRAGNQRSNNGQIVLGGPGDLLVEGGEGIDLGNSSGIVTRGNAANPYLPERGASIRLRTGDAAGVNYAAFIARYLDSDTDEARQYRPALSTYMWRRDGLAEGDAQGFAERYVEGEGGTGRSYQAELTAYMRQLTGDPGLTDAQALEAFLALPAAQQAPFFGAVHLAEFQRFAPDAQTAFVNQVLFAELQAAGGEGRDGGGYERGYSAIRTLFPRSDFTPGAPAGYTGDLNLFFSQVKTEQGGDIEMLVPGGVINAGLANSGNLAKSASQLGIVTVRGGTIRSMVYDDFLVNQSRVFTLQGGDIVLWSSVGDIDAGRGAKTASATPPPQIVFRGDRFVLDTSRSIEGSGIGVLLAKAGIEPGNVFLFAPRGEVNAGDAGIRSAGNLTIGAVRVVGAENIQVGGVSAGVPASSAGSVAGLAGSSNVAAEAAKSAEKATESFASNSAALPQTGLVPSFITVEVIGLGDDDDDSTRARGR